MLQLINRVSDITEAVTDKWFEEGYEAAVAYLTDLYENKFITRKVFDGALKDLTELENTPDISMDELEKEMAWLLK